MSPSYPQVLLQNRKPDRIATLDEYRASGGYQALNNVLKDFSHKDVQQSIMNANLLGRGGAAFPTGMKLMSVTDDASFPRYIVCNADEMEPGTFKDRVLIHADPHMLIEGIIIAGYASLAEKGIIFIRPEYENAARILEKEIKIAQGEGYLGKNILGSDYSLELVVHRSAGRYICGEVTAQLNALMGKRPNPMKPPPYPTEKGLWDRPTVLSNVETFACLPHIIRNGGQWFKDLAITESGAGTKLFGISGKVNKPGCYELPMGVRLSEIIEVHAGGMLAGSEYKACLPGGASTGFLPREHYDIEMDFDPLRNVGNRLGTGAIMVFDHKTCLVGATVNLIEFFARESCGWCTPCREGLPYILDLLKRIEQGDGQPEFVPMLDRMCKYLWNAYCAFAPGAVAPVESLLKHFADEIQEHISQKKCPFR
ncbi:NADH dehydrogenase [Alkalispirochaeta odontotermitis]|nr:NADH dehydrogenase [Alkalispirochaeta odontotermitis]CAB1083312.1 NADH-ubiquinone oxidoreductase chain F (EC [Olavius algarvensis Delta 1 endosymbiont]